MVTEEKLWLHQRILKRTRLLLGQEYFQMAILLFIFALIIGVFSLFMIGVADKRAGVNQDNYEQYERVYNGRVSQYSINTDKVAMNAKVVEKYKADNAQIQVSEEFLEQLSKNVEVIATRGDVELMAEFAKIGLRYQPSYRTKFVVEYDVQNKSDKVALASFNFPLPFSYTNNEISGAAIYIDGTEVENSKKSNGESSKLTWSGEFAAAQKRTIKVTYTTVGVSQFSYTGLDNAKRSQNFEFRLAVVGTRSYNVNDGLSVDRREFSKDKVVLIWDKDDLFSTPSIDISIGDKVDPSAKVARVYVLMLPLYIITSMITLFFFAKFSTKKAGLLDMALFSILFAVFFPLFHYFASFTIDPTVEIFSRFSKVGNYSMPLYTGFALAWLIVSALVIYLFGKIGGFGFALRFILPTLVLFLGFFPLVVTIPEYAVLLVLIGVIALLAIAVQVNLSLKR